MAIDFSKNRDKDIEEITEKLFAKLQKQGLVAEEIGEQVGEGFADGLEHGFEDAASRIVASSLKINKAFKDLAKKITSQSISLSDLNIDFSDIDINEADFQKKINEVFEKFKIDNAIEFDSTAVEKQFKNMLVLHTKYALKLSKLREQAPRLTNPASIKANAQEQLAIIDGLKEIQKILDQTSGMSVELPHVYFGDVKELRTSISLIEQMEKGEAKIARQHDTNAEKIRKENKELKERNKLLEEKVGPIEGGELPPARKSRARKPKVETADAMAEKIGNEMLAFGSQLGELEKELGDPNNWLNKFNTLMVQIQQGALTASEAVAKLREEVSHQLAEEAFIAQMEKAVAEEVEAELKAEQMQLDLTKEELKTEKEITKEKEKQYGYHAGKFRDDGKRAESLWQSTPGRSTGFYGTGTYLTDSAHLNEITTGQYGRRPLNVIDPDMYNLFDATNDKTASQLHEFLKHITNKAFGGKGENIKSLYAEFKKIFPKEQVITYEDFKAFVGELQGYVKNNFDNYSKSSLMDSVSTKFMKNFGYEGVDTRGTKYADTTYGTVIYDLKEESIVLKEITDEMQKQEIIAGNIASVIESQARTHEQTKANKSTNQQAKEIKNVVKLVDNYGESLDEVNNKLMEGTKFLDEQGRVIRLFHQSKEVFDKFDPSKSGGSQGVGTLGKGNYLHFGNGGKFDDPKYGRYQTQWYANINKVFDAENDELSPEQINGVLDKFLPGLSEGDKKNYINKFGKKYTVQAIKYVAQRANAEVLDVWKYLGYDAARRGDEINIFDSSKIFRANDNVLDMAKPGKSKFARTINGRSGKFTIKKPTPTTYETESGQMSVLPAVKEEVDAKNKLAETNNKVAESQKKVNEVAQGVQMTIDDIVPASAEETVPKVEAEAKALDKVSAAAEKAVKSKKKFAGANKEVANSTGPSVKGLKAEADAAEEVAWSMTRLGTKSIPLGGNTDAMDDFNLPHAYMGEKGQDAVQMFAGLKSEIEEMTGKPVIIDFVSKVNDDGQLAAVGATLKYVNEEAGVTVKQFYKIEERENGILVATQSQEKATLAASKAAKVFNTEMQQKLALEQIRTLEGQMGSLELDLTEVKNAANAINDKASLEHFNLALRSAKEQAKQLKTELKGQNTLDTIASMERALLTLPSRLEEVQRRLRALGDIEGVDAIDDVLRSINDEYQRFLRSDDSEEKVKLFRNLTSSMVWANAEMRNLSGKNAENQRQKTAAKNTEDAQKKAARESYAAWWKATIDEQSVSENEAKVRQKQEQTYSDWWNKALFDREQQEKAKDERVIAARKKQEEAYDAWWQKALYNKEKAPNLRYGKTTANSARRKLDSTEGAVDALGVTNPKVLTKLDAYRDKVKEVEDIRDKFASDASAAEDEGLVKQFQKASYEAEQLRRGIKAITDEEQRLMQLSEEQGFDPIELTPDQIANLKNEMIAHAKATAQGRMEIKGWDGDNKKLYYTVTDSKGAVEEMTMALGQGTNRMFQYRTATKETGTLMEQIFKGIKVKAKELLSFVIGGGSVYKVIELLRQGIQYVREIDLALTELRKVTNETEEEYDQFLKTAAKTGARLGTTISAVTEATATFAKLGYTMKQSAEMAEAAIVYKNVGDNIASTGDAADSIISTMKGFRLEASESMAIVDRFNEVGNRFAITSQGIGEALRLSASALSEGGNSLDESIGLITAANEVVNDPSSVGTALKTLTLRLRGSKTELEEMGEDVTDMATTTSALQAKLLALTGGQVDIMADANTFKNSTQILREMADAWEDMTDIQRASALELMGGKRQANVLSALIQNFDTVEEAIEASESSSGSALRENEKYLDSFQGRLDQLQNAVQTKWSEALDTDTIKDAIQLFTKLVNTLDFEDSALIDVASLLIKLLSQLADLFDGNLLNIVIAFFGARYIKNNGLFDALAGIKKKGEETIESLTKDISNLDDEISKLTEKAHRQSGKSQQKTQQQKKAAEDLRVEKQNQLDAMKLSKTEQQEVADSFDISDDIKKIQDKVTDAQKKLSKAQETQSNLLSVHGFADMEEYQQSLIEREKMLLKSKKTVEEKLAKENRPEYQTALNNIDDNLSKNSKQIEWAKKRSDAVKQYETELQDAQGELDKYNQKIQQTDASMQKNNATTNKSSATTGVNTGTTTTNTGAVNANQSARQSAGAQTDQHTQDLNENTDATNKNTGAQNKNTKSLSGAGAKLKEFGKQMLQTAAYMAIIQGAMQVLDGIAWIIEEIVDATSDGAKSFEELQEEFEVLNSDLAESESKLGSLESTLEDVESQIEDIQSLGTLSFTKKEELENLQKQSAELKRQIEMQEILTKNKQGQVNSAALTAAKAYMQQSAETDKTLDEATAETRETGEKIGGLVDGLLMVAGGITMVATGWTGVGAVVGAAMMGVGAAGVGNKVGGAIGEGVGEAEYKKQETNQQAIDNYAARRKEYEDKLSAAYASSDAEEYSKILEEYNKFESMMADNIGALLEYTSSTDYDTLTTAQKEQYEAYQKMINLYSKANGGSLTSIADSVFELDGYEKAGYEIDQIQKQLKNEEISAESAKQQIVDLINQTPGLAAEFIELGYKVETVADAYVLLGEAAAESMSLMDSLDKISAVTSAFDELGGAVQEFMEEGSVSIGTLEGLNEKFGELDGFEDLYKVLATGEGDLATAVTNVANAYIGQSNIMADMTDEELQIMTSRLEALGVLNAQEVIMARQKGQEQINALGLAYSIDLNNYSTAEQAKLAMAQAAGISIADIADTEIKTLAGKYGVDLENYATKEEQKLAIAMARAKAEADINKQSLESDYKAGKIDYSAYQSGITDLDNSLDFISTYDTINGILNSAFQDFQFNFDGQVGIGTNFKEDFDEDDDGIKDEVEDQIKKDWDKLVNQYENQLALLSNERDLIEAEIDKAEAHGGKASAKYYDDLISNSTAEKQLLEEKKAALEEYLAANAGAIDQDTWTEYNNEINATAVAIKECEINTLEWAEAVREIDLHYFEQASDEISRLGDELEFVNSLLEDEEVADENGNWSSAALTRMGMYTNQMEMAAANAARYQKEIDDLNDEYENGAISEEQYQERLSDLVSGQQDAIMSYEDAKDSIVELNEARVDAIREGIEKEIEAYEDLIDAKKEELDAERDLHDFREDIKDQTKDIASLERRIAALSGSSAASDVAERRKLEAQLLEAKEGLNDTYYGHSRDAQSAALDEEAEAYTLSKERYIEQLEERLEDAETLIQNSIMDVMLNADAVYTELNELADIYGVDLSDSLMLPWQKASEQAIAWKDELKDSMTSGEYAALIGEGGAITVFANGVAAKLQGSWSKAQTAAKNYAGYLTGAELKNQFTNTLTGFGNQIQNIINKWNGVKAAADAAYTAQTRVASVSGNSNVGGGSNNGGGGVSGGAGTSQPTYTPPAQVDSRILSKYKLTSSQVLDLGYGPISLEKFEQLLRDYQIKYSAIYKQVANTRDIERLSKKVMYGEYVSGSWAIRQYAKGTTGTERDEWAITDEPQFGDELVLVPGKDGNLSFMRKGTGIVPADMTQKLFELAQIPTSDLMNKNLTAIVPNITKNDFKNEFNFESLVHVDTVDSDTLPKLEKLVDKKIDDFSRALNYSLKKFSR